MKRPNDDQDVEMECVARSKGSVSLMTVASGKWQCTVCSEWHTSRSYNCRFWVWLGNDKHFLYSCERCTLQYQHRRAQQYQQAEASQIQGSQAASSSAGGSSSGGTAPREPVIPPKATGMAYFIQQPAASGLGSAASSSAGGSASGSGSASSGATGSGAGSLVAWVLLEMCMSGGLVKQSKPSGS